MKINTLRNPLFILALVGGFAVAGCGDDDNASPSTTTIEDEDASTSDNDDNDDANNNESDDEDASSDTTTESDTESDTTTTSDTTPAADASDTSGDQGDASDTSGNTDEDAGAGQDDDAGTELTTADAGNDAGPVEEGCVENDDACFSCPTTPEQFLTQCEAPGTQCSAFDNSSRLGLYVEGEELPTP